MENLSLEGEQIIKDIGNLFRQEKKLKQLMIEYLEILKIIWSMKKKNKIIINKKELGTFGGMVIEIKHYQLKNVLVNLDHI